MFSDNINKCCNTPFSSQEKYEKVKYLAPVKFLECMICCNEITNLDNQMIGDPVDIIMLQSSGFEINDSEEILSDSLKKHGCQFLAKMKSMEDTSNLSESRANLFKFEADYTHGIVKRF
jgi:hypothetical protein